MDTVTTTGQAAEWGHWYTRTGRPVYEIKGANGAMRAVTLRDARKFFYVPGFSAIAKMEHQPGLERWKIEQAYMAAMTLPRIEGESLERFMARCRTDAGAQSQKARDRGSDLHAALQRHFEGRAVDPNDYPYTRPVVEWLAKHFPMAKWHSEKSFAHHLGYGGKLDLHCDEAVVDFKFKDFREEPAKSFAYPEHGMQLYAYANGVNRPHAVKLNLFISSTVPGLIVPHEWEEPAQWEAFQCLLKLWQLRRGYQSGFASVQ